MECHECLKQCHIKRHLDLNEFEAADCIVREILEQANEKLRGSSSLDMNADDRDGLHESAAWCRLVLCQIAYRRSDWPLLAELVQEVTDVTHCTEPEYIAEAQLWQAIVHISEGNLTLAATLKEKAIASSAFCNAPKGGRYWEALCGVDELLGRFELARANRELQLKEVEGRGMKGVELMCGREIKRLLERGNQPLLGSPLVKE